MGFGAAAEAVSFHSTREATSLACAGYIYMFTNSKQVHIDHVAFFYTNFFGTEFTQEAQWRQFTLFEMTQGSASQTLGLNLTET